jgi:hypothetical protein
MLDRRNRAEPYGALAEACRHLATSAPSSQMKNRYLLMAQDYMSLADLREQAHPYHTPATVEENAAWAAAVTGRFPGPWRTVEIPHGFAVDDASGQQLAVFYGMAEPDAATQTDFLTVDEARQMAVDFAKLPELIEQTSGRSEVDTSSKDDGLIELETNRSAQGALETWPLPRVAQLPAVASLPLAEMPTIVPKFTSFEPDEWMSTPMSPRPSGPLSNRTKFLIAIVVLVLPAGYFIVRNSGPRVEVAAVPQVATDIPPAEFLPLREAQVPSVAAAGTNAESRVEPEIPAASLPQTAPLDTTPTEGAIEAKPRPMLPERGSFAGGRDASTCFSSASAVRENRPGAWPSWTLRAPGHEGTRCWYAATRATTHDHR